MWIFLAHLKQERSLCGKKLVVKKLVNGQRVSIYDVTNNKTIVKSARIMKDYLIKRNESNLYLN